MRVVKVEFRYRRSSDGLNAYTVWFEDGGARVVDAYDEMGAWQLAMYFEQPIRLTSI